MRQVQGCARIFCLRDVGWDLFNEAAHGHVSECGGKRQRDTAFGGEVGRSLEKRLRRSFLPLPAQSDTIAAHGQRLQLLARPRGRPTFPGLAASSGLKALRYSPGVIPVWRVKTMTNRDSLPSPHARAI